MNPVLPARREACGAAITRSTAAQFNENHGPIQGERQVEGYAGGQRLSLQVRAKILFARWNPLQPR